MDPVLALAIFVLGLTFGSFLNVCIYRMPRSESISFPGSRCTSCGTAIRWYDNIPVFGWIKLAGKCRFCKEPISPRYPIVEARADGTFTVIESLARSPDLTINEQRKVIDQFHNLEPFTVTDALLAADLRLKMQPEKYCGDL